MSEKSLIMANESNIKIDSFKLQPDCEIKIKIYKRRWLMLILYMFYAAIAYGQFIEFFINRAMISSYYNKVSLFAIQCDKYFSLTYYLIFVLPTTYLFDRFGLRSVIILGSLLCCLGSWIKIYSVASKSYFILQFGQFLISVSLVIWIPIPSQLAATWFGEDKFSTATALSFFGKQISIAIMDLIVSMFKWDINYSIKNIGIDLSYLYWFIGLFSSLSFILILIFFKDEPELPPSKTRALQKNNLNKDRKSYPIILKKLLMNKNFLIFCNSYGLNHSIFVTTYRIFMSLIILHNLRLKDGLKDVYVIGWHLFGLLGTVLFGVILDKFHSFKKTTVIVYFLILCCQILLATAFVMEVRWMIHVVSTFINFFTSGYLVLGYILASEYTYPIQEFQSAAILNIFCHVYRIIFYTIIDFVPDRCGELYAHVIMCVTLLVGLILTILTKDEHRRQDARKTARYCDVSWEA